MFTSPRRRALATGVALTLALAACGGSDDGSAAADVTSAPTAAPRARESSVAATAGTAMGTEDHHGSDPSALPGADSVNATTAGSAVELRIAMRDLWTDHMQWTWSTVVAFATNPDGLQPQLDRLLANQDNIGAAVGAYYGDEAGQQLATLLKEHINEAVPVLTAAQAGDDAALRTAIDDWYLNAQAIADFLSAANPANWPQDATRPALEHHITSTVDYAGAALAGDFAAAVEHYDGAFDHMMMLADTLTAGIIAAFPDHFTD